MKSEEVGPDRPEKTFWSRWEKRFEKQVVEVLGSTCEEDARLTSLEEDQRFPFWET
jgi:hypothetical protein